MGDRPSVESHRASAGEDTPRRQALLVTRAFVALTVLGATGVLGGCRILPARKPGASAPSPTNRARPEPSRTTLPTAGPKAAIDPRKATIRVGIGGSADQRVLAAMYAVALRASGYRTTLDPGGPSPTDTEKALDAAVFDVAVEHLDDALAALGTPPPAIAGPSPVGSSRRNRRTVATSPAVGANDAARALLALNGRLANRGLQALLPTSSGHQLVLAANRTSADQEGWHRISDLRRFAFRRRLGGPFGCSEDDRCALVLRRSYGLGFQEVVEFDNVGPSPQNQGSSRAVAAAVRGDVDVAFARDDDPALTNGSLVALEDDRRVLTSGNFVPLVRRAVLDPEVRATMDTVSAALVGDDLDVLAGQVEAGQPVEAVAADWLARAGITGPRQS